ncbi:MAG: M48 family metallopeptidase [Myxococcales bacterium]|nr:M48 family metallopeptidase [Myxococcales bacterium]
MLTLNRTLVPIALLLMTSACVQTHSGRRALILIPNAQEMKLGADAFKEVNAKEKRCGNAQANALVQDIGRRIAAVSPKPRWQWQFHLFDSPNMANAFALPGGKVGVYTGLMKYAGNAAGLAAVVGHEVAHAIQRHGAERMSRAMIVKAGLSAADVTLKNGKYHDQIMAAMGIGANVGVMLPYSRDMELEADRMGLLYMARAGYDPVHAIHFWQRFGKANKGQIELISTHPANQRRIDGLKAALPEAQRIYATSSRLGAGMQLSVPNCGASTFGAAAPSRPSPSRTAPAPAPTKKSSGGRIRPGR